MEPMPLIASPLPPVEPASSRSDESLSALPVAPQALTPQASAAMDPTVLGPWYHTTGIVLLLPLYAFVSHLTHRVPGGTGTLSQTEQRVSEAAHAIAQTPKVPFYLRPSC